MFDVLAKLYREGKITKTQLDEAVTRSWITAEQEQQIIDSGGDVGVLVVTATA